MSTSRLGGLGRAVNFPQALGSAASDDCRGWTALLKSLRSAATTWRGRLLHDGLADLAHHGARFEAHCATATAAPDNQTRPHKHTHRVEQGIMHSPPQSTHAPQACWSTTTAHLPTMGGYCKQAKNEVALSIHHTQQGHLNLKTPDTRVRHP